MPSKKSRLRNAGRRRARQREYPRGGEFGESTFVDRKLAQLCQQAREALSYALAGSADWVLRDVLIDSVMPAPDATRLLIAVHPTEIEQIALLARLDAARGYLRSEVAAAIHRKRAPELVFRIASGGSSEPHSAASNPANRNPSKHNPRPDRDT
ncbi:MAG: ribosome-binding factor A [Proteobacteria bacterium]|nr:ribosome-binding factor A [Pseudomonadota bacterium]